MENIILGLLLLQPRTIYQLRKRIDEGLNLMYSCSTGSIQAAIKKLLASGCICMSADECGRQKKVYAITDEGKQRFSVWINGAIATDTAKNPELAKIYFMGLSDKSNRIAQLENHITNLHETFCELEKIYQKGEELYSHLPQNDVLFFQLQTAKYGRDFLQFNIEWYGKLLTNLRRE